MIVAFKHLSQLHIIHTYILDFFDHVANVYILVFQIYCTYNYFDHATNILEFHIIYSSSLLLDLNFGVGFLCVWGWGCFKKYLPTFIILFQFVFVLTVLFIIIITFVHCFIN